MNQATSILTRAGGKQGVAAAPGSGVGRAGTTGDGGIASHRQRPDQHRMPLFHQFARLQGAIDGESDPGALGH